LPEEGPPLYNRAMAGIHVGTSGYSYADWVGPVYPPGTQARDFLALYARELDMVELNFSFYSRPRAAQLDRMADVAGERLLFSLKAHQSLSHQRPEDPTAESALLREAVRPLLERSRLAAVLVQFPFSFHYDVPSRLYLDRLCRSLEGLPIAVEFRNRGWQRESVLQALSERGVAFANVDQPDLPDLMEAGEAATADLAYVRFHGRNGANWWTGDNASRYDYLYSEVELEGWVERIRAILRRARTLLVAFNNHFRGQAVQNAHMMKTLLVQQGLEPPG
jgi:uncharacterized protein YecE (DUF72 family)